MHSFRSIYTALIKTFSVSRTAYSKPIRSWIFLYFSFTFYIQFILFAGKEALEIKLYSEWTSVSRELVSTEFYCGRISVIVHCSASEKLAVVHSSCSFGAESYSGQRERKNVWQGFQWKICELVSGKLSKSLYIHSYTHLITSSALNECR